MMITTIAKPVKKMKRTLARTADTAAADKIESTYVNEDGSSAAVDLSPDAAHSLVVVDLDPETIKKSDPR